MANPHLAHTLARFLVRMQRTKNRQLAIPADVQRQLGLEKRAENDIVLVSIRKGARGRWNHHLFPLTYDNEFAIPTDVTAIGPGDEVEVKVHAVFSGSPKPVHTPPAGGAAVLLQLDGQARPGFRSDGSTNIDAYLTQSDEDDGQAGVR